METKKKIMQIIGFAHYYNIYIYEYLSKKKKYTVYKIDCFRIILTNIANRKLKWLFHGKSIFFSVNTAQFRYIILFFNLTINNIYVSILCVVEFPCINRRIENYIFYWHSYSLTLRFLRVIEISHEWIEIIRKFLLTA